MTKKKGYGPFPTAVARVDISDRGGDYRIVGYRIPKWESPMMLDGLLALSRHDRLAEKAERLPKVKAMLGCVLGELGASDGYAALDNPSNVPSVWQIKNALIREKVMEIMKELGDD